MKKLIVYLSISALVVSLLVSNTISAQQDYNNELKYTGEEIFKSIVFGIGPATKEFPEIFSKAVIEELNTSESIKTANLIVSKIKKQNPAYFDQIEQAILERNPIKLDSLLSSSGKYITSINEVEKVVSGKISRPDAICGPTVCGAYLYVAGVHAVALVATAGAVFGLYLWVEKEYWFSEGKTSSLYSTPEEKQYQKELLIKNIIERTAY
jgi:SdpC family antimicrobial peptide